MLRLQCRRQREIRLDIYEQGPAQSETGKGNQDAESGRDLRGTSPWPTSVELSLKGAFARRSGRRYPAASGRSRWPFGYRSHSCPGQFDAIREIKMVVAPIVTKLDFKSIDDELAQTLLTRPPRGLTVR